MTHFPSLEGKRARPATSKDQQNACLTCRAWVAEWGLAKWRLFIGATCPYLRWLCGRLPTSSKWLSNQALTLSKPLEGGKILGLVTGCHTASFCLNLPREFDTSNADYLLTWMETSRCLVYPPTWIAAFGPDFSLEPTWFPKPCRLDSKTAQVYYLAYFTNQLNSKSGNSNWTWKIRP